MFEDFCTCFNDADSVIVADVYTAGEQPIDGANKEALAEGLKSHGHKHVDVLPNSESLPAIIAAQVQNGDFVICLGAGDITKWAYALPAQLEAILSKSEKQRA